MFNVVCVLAMLAGVWALVAYMAEQAAPTTLEGAKGLFHPLRNAGAPGAGTDEVHTLTLGGSFTSGTFRMSYGGRWTGDITYSATPATMVANIQSALDDLLGSGETTVAGTSPYTITFGGNRAKLLIPEGLPSFDLSGITGSSPTITPTKSTPGVTATGRGAPKGAKLIDATNGIDYINTGTQVAPTWTKTGTQT